MSSENTLKIWNYRVIKHHSDQGKYYEIHAVYYDDQGIPVACTAESASAYGETVDELSRAMIHMQSALTQPVLDAKLFENTTNSPQDINGAINMMKKNSSV